MFTEGKFLIIIYNKEFPNILYNINNLFPTFVVQVTPIRDEYIEIISRYPETLLPNLNMMLLVESKIWSVVFYDLLLTQRAR